MADEVKRGERLTAGKLNKGFRAFARQTRGRGIQTRVVNDHLVIGGGVDRPQWDRFVVVTAWHNDWLECQWWDPVAEEAFGSVSVAKPYELRRTPFHGEAITYADGSTIGYSYATSRRRQATKGAASEYQVVTPDYWVGAVLRVRVGNTGIVDGDDQPILWEDCNSAGRAWAKEPD